MLYLIYCIAYIYHKLLIHTSQWFVAHTVYEVQSSYLSQEGMKVIPLEGMLSVTWPFLVWITCHCFAVYNSFLRCPSRGKIIL